ncbi:DMT family transporter [Bacillus massiliglaciei]|uniref:DMT family transporter n=1 Tax=Bacillus massiliglaciei TaxID=1816693 RepID=UPI000A8BEA79|nr:multidrug resistance efflux transporter family protein [Bacillus massiliglaciei]
MRPIVLGILAAFFFAFTFVLNAAMELSGGSWIWSASLRYMFMVPFLLCIVWARGNLREVFREMLSRPGKWLLWSFVGFVLFYAPLCFAASYAPGWLIAGTWQITIISGALLAPLFIEKIMTKNGPVEIRGKIAFKGLGMSFVILAGILMMQWEHAEGAALNDLWLGIIPVLAASIAYPLGNRKMMALTDGSLDAYQRVLGMTLASLPFWFLLSIYGIWKDGLPSMGQTAQSLLVAVSSGVIATVLFFKATDMVRGDMQKLASVEATQSMEVLFALAGEVIVLSIALPSSLSWAGICVVAIGMIMHSLFSHPKPKKTEKAASL